MDRYTFVLVVAALLVGSRADAQKLPTSSVPDSTSELGQPARSSPHWANLQFDHVNILVSDLAESALFYRDILQLDELQTPWGPNPSVRFFSIGGNQQVHVVQMTDETPERMKVLHMAFTVGDFDAYLAFLREAGISYANFSGADGEIELRPDGVRQVYFRDPDGNWIEINDATYEPTG